MAKVLGFGTVVKHDHNSDNTYSTISNVERVKAPDDFDYNETEVTSLDDTTEEFVRGIQKAKMFEFTVFWDESDNTHTTLRGNTTVGAGDSTGFPWQIITPDATPKTIAFNGYILNIGDTTFAPKDAIMKTVKVRLTSEPTYT